MSPQEQNRFLNKAKQRAGGEIILQKAHSTSIWQTRPDLGIAGTREELPVIFRLS